MDRSALNIPFYDVIVVGAGPAGAEAALAAAKLGARTLCLSINLDNAGFPPATPVLIDTGESSNSVLLREMSFLDGFLPKLVVRDDVLVIADMGDGDGFQRLVIDRRSLGLAYKETLESAGNLELRQSLVTSIEPDITGSERSRWRITGNLGELFQAACVVVAAGTFLRGSMVDGGERKAGARTSEIPAIALADSLKSLGLELVEIEAVCGTRLDQRSLTYGNETEPQTRVDMFKSFSKCVPDGARLQEVLAPQAMPSGNRQENISAAKAATNSNETWVTRTGYCVRHLTLNKLQVNKELETVNLRGLYFAGRAAGARGYIAAAASGLIAGTNAAGKALEAEPRLIQGMKYVSDLCDAIAVQKNRPVEI